MHGTSSLYSKTTTTTMLCVNVFQLSQEIHVQGISYPLWLRSCTSLFVDGAAKQVLRTGLGAQGGKPTAIEMMILETRLPLQNSRGQTSKRPCDGVEVHQKFQGLSVFKELTDHAASGREGQGSRKAAVHSNNEHGNMFKASPIPSGCVAALHFLSMVPLSKY